MANIRIDDDAHWHAIREQNIGGSEIASLFYEVEVPADDGQPPNVVILSICDPLPPGARPLECLSPYKTGYRLWLEKAGQLKPDELDNERIDAGNFLEAGLAGWAQKKWPDLRMRKVRRYMTHPQISGWGCTLDYETVQGLLPVEFKNVDAMVFKDKWAMTGDDIDAPPLHISLQLQAQLGVSGRADGIVIACVGGNELRKGVFKLHEATQIKIATAVAQFWESIRLGRPPTAFADISTAAEFYRFGDKSIPMIDIDSPVVDQLADDLRKVMDDRKRLEKIEEGLKGRIAVSMGKATKIRTASYQISWPAVTKPAQVYPAKWMPEITFRQGIRISERK